MSDILTESQPWWLCCRAALGKEPTGYEYIGWIDGKWGEFADSLGRPKGADTQDFLRQKLGPDKGERFSHWLIA